MATKTQPGKGERTRERLLGAAVGEFRRVGVAKADIKAIASAAGVAPGTFYFHFPTKEHVLIELERREEDRIATELSRYFTDAPGVSAVLTKVVDAVAGLKGVWALRCSRTFWRCTSRRHGRRRRSGRTTL